MAKCILRKGAKMRSWIVDKKYRYIIFSRKDAKEQRRKGELPKGKCGVILVRKKSKM